MTRHGSLLRPMGDQALQVRFDTEGEAIAFGTLLRESRCDHIVDVVQAYRTVAAFYDPATTELAAVEQVVANALGRMRDRPPPQSEVKQIPCCYDFALDFDRIEQHIGLSRQEIIRLHSGVTYTVYAIGFCPGFPYLGYLPDALAGVPRLESPRLKVPRGSVGLTGRQTGIYTLERPGGWNIIGRTPLELVDVRDRYFPLRVGDRVRFEPIDERAFRQLLHRRL